MEKVLLGTLLSLLTFAVFASDTLPLSNGQQVKVEVTNCSNVEYGAFNLVQNDTLEAQKQDNLA